MTIHSGGSVGIGTASPGQKLDVIGIIRSSHTNPQVRIHTSSGTGTGYLVFGDSADDDVGQVYYSHASNQMGFVVGGGSADMVLNSSGNLTVVGTVTGTTIGNKGTNLGQQMEQGNAATTTLRFDSDIWRLYSGGSGGVGAVFNLKENGNLGIGLNNTTPEAIINTGSYFKPDSGGQFVSLRDPNGGFLMLESSSTTDNDQIGGIFFNSTSGQSDAHRNLAGIDSIIHAHGTTSLSGADLRFFTKQSGSGNANPRMLITHTGVVEFKDDAGNADMYWDKTHLRLMDNNKLKFGNGGDLEIYHTGTNSYLSLIHISEPTRPY